MIQYAEEFLYGLIGIFFSAITWLVRTVLTNQKQIELLQNEIKNRETFLQEVKADIKDLKTELLEIYKNKL